MNAVVDTSPLIFLAKLGRLELLPSPCGTTPLVMAEIERGSDRGHGEALAVGKLVKEGLLVVAAARPSRLRREAGLDAAEASVLQLAVDRGLRQVVVDDRAAIRAAKLLGLEPVSTPFLALRARRAGSLSPTAFRAVLDRLVEERHFLSAPLYQRLLERGEKGP